MPTTNESQSTRNRIARWAPALLSIAAGVYLFVSGVLLVRGGNTGWAFYVAAMNLVPAVVDVASARPIRGVYKFVFWIDVALCVFAVATILYIPAVMFVGPPTAALGFAWRLATRLARASTRVSDPD